MIVIESKFWTCIGVNEKGVTYPVLEEKNGAPVRYSSFALAKERCRVEVEDESNATIAAMPVKCIAKYTIGSDK